MLIEIFSTTVSKLCKFLVFANADIRAMADKLYCYDDAKVASKILRLIEE
jgi:hypothetical protein